MTQTSLALRPGRPALPGRVRFSTTVTSDQIARLREIGAGSVPLGIVRCLDAFDLLSRAGVELSASSAAEPPAAA